MESDNELFLMPLSLLLYVCFILLYLDYNCILTCFGQRSKRCLLFLHKLDRILLAILYKNQVLFKIPSKVHLNLQHYLYHVYQLLLLLSSIRNDVSGLVLNAILLYVLHHTLRVSSNKLMEPFWDLYTKLQ